LKKYSWFRHLLYTVLLLGLLLPGGTSTAQTKIACNERVLLLLQGIETEYSSWTETFGDIINAAGPRYNKVLPFSYNLQDRNNYTKKNTHQHLSHSVSALRQTINEEIQRCPGVSIDLLGHSLGGLIALNYTGTEEQGPALRHIKHLVTLDSPVNGSSKETIRVMADKVSYDLAESDVAQVLVQLNQEIVLNRNIALAERLKEKVVIRTLSSVDDVMVPTLDAMIPGFEVFFNLGVTTGVKCASSAYWATCAGHEQILHAQSAIRTIKEALAELPHGEALRTGEIAYTGADGNIWLARLATGEKRKLTQDGQPIESYARHWYSNLAWSPDGTTLAYTRIKADHSTELLLTDVFSGRTRVVAKGALPSWSPSGEFIVFLDSATQSLGFFVGTIAVFDVQRQRILSHGSSNVALYYPPSWSGDDFDNLWFVYAATDTNRSPYSRVEVAHIGLPRTSGLDFSLTYDKQFFNAQWSPSQGKIAYMSAQRSRPAAVMVYDSATQTSTKVLDVSMSCGREMGMVDFQLSWLGQTSKLLVGTACRQDEKPIFWRVDTANNNVQRFTVKGAIAVPSFDGGAIAAVDYTCREKCVSTLTITNASGGGEVVINQADSPAWNPKPPQVLAAHNPGESRTT